MEPGAPTESTEEDRWADWLVRGRERGAARSELRKMHADLRRLRRRVLSGARLKPGHVVLDVGAGTGLLALEARRRVAPSGAVIALDVSADALLECRRAVEDEPVGPPVLPVVGDARELPLRDRSIDSAVLRSVLIYLPDKASAIRELHRILRPGGRVSLFEPINRVYVWPGAWPGDLDLTPIQPSYDRVIASLEPTWQTLVDFDERDLATWFVEAGFSAVDLRFEYRYSSSRRLRRQEAIQAIEIRPNPNTPSYEEAARRILGRDADEHLDRYLQLLLSKPFRESRGEAFLTAVRSA